VLNESPKPFKVLLFGSYAYGTPRDDSDIDLVVVLDKDGKSTSYKTLIDNRMEISRRLRQLRKQCSVDVLVYTRDEWEELKASQSSFVQKIEREGISIL